jgi:hypothetical protein
MNIIKNSILYATSNISIDNQYELDNYIGNIINQDNLQAESKYTLLYYLFIKNVLQDRICIKFIENIDTYSVDNMSSLPYILHELTLSDIFIDNSIRLWEMNKLNINLDSNRFFDIVIDTLFSRFITNFYPYLAKNLYVTRIGSSSYQLLACKQFKDIINRHYPTFRDNEYTLTSNNIVFERYIYYPTFRDNEYTLTSSNIDIIDIFSKIMSIDINTIPSQTIMLELINNHRKYTLEYLYLSFIQVLIYEPINNNIMCYMNNINSINSDNIIELNDTLKYITHNVSIENSKFLKLLSRTWCLKYQQNYYFDIRQLFLNGLFAKFMSVYLPDFYNSIEFNSTLETVNKAKYQIQIKLESSSN